MPIFIDTANYCKEKNLNVLFARIEQDKNPKASDEYNAFYYPTVVLVIKENKYVFGEEKTIQAFYFILKAKDMIILSSMDALMQRIFFPVV